MGWLEKDHKGKIIKRAESLRIKDTKFNRRIAGKIKKEKEMDLSRPKVIKRYHYWLSDAWDEFMKYEKRSGGRSGTGIKGTTISHYKKVKETLDIVIGNKYVQELTEEDVADVRDYLSQKQNANYKHKKIKVSKNTTASYLRHLRTFLNYIYSKHYISEKIPVHIKTYKSKKRPCPPYVLKTALSYLKERNLEQYKAIMLLAMTGLRSGELCRLRWEDIDFVNKIIYIQNTKADEENEEFPLYPSLEKFLSLYKKDSGKVVIYKNAQSFRFWADALNPLISIII